MPSNLHIQENSLDDLLRTVMTLLLEGGVKTAAHRGETREVTGILLHLANPRARLSQTEKKGHVFSCIGELLWYLAGTDDLAFIRYYIERYAKESEDNKTVYGAYGPRLFNMHGRFNQLQTVIELLRRNGGTRRAVIQLFDARDNENAPDESSRHIEIPCTCTIQYFLREGRLHAFTSMRSNDAYLGLPHDVFAFTMLQEIVARSLGADLGDYKHSVGSLHLYSDQVDLANEYLREGWQPTISMPPMPIGDPWPQIDLMLEAERELRVQGTTKLRENLAPYWQDLVLLLEVYSLYFRQRPDEILSVRDRFSSPVYAPYVEQRRRAALARLGR